MHSCTHFLLNFGVVVHIVDVQTKKPHSHTHTHSRSFAHSLARCSLSIQDLELVVEEYPEVLQKQDVWGCTPLTYILQNDPSLKVVKYVVEKYPEALKIGNLNNKMYPNP